ncbi:MAG: cupin domain-containing protein [Dehalococcoidia bacterium]|nr:cupin domain-containing protein [Dehalococcoidia bacterium]
MTAPRVPEYLTTHVLSGDRLVYALDREAAELTRGLAGHGRRAITLTKQPPLTVVLMAMEAGNHVAEHSTAGSTTVLVVSGEVRVMVNGTEEIILRDRQLAVIGPNVRHDLHADRESLLLITVALTEEAAKA